MPKRILNILKQRRAFRALLPEVPERKSGKLRVFLNNEFDTTNPLDKEVFVSLVEEAANKSFAPKEREKIFAFLRLREGSGEMGKKKLIRFIRESLFTPAPTTKR